MGLGSQLARAGVVVALRGAWQRRQAQCAARGLFYVKRPHRDVERQATCVSRRCRYMGASEKRLRGVTSFSESSWSMDLSSSTPRSVGRTVVTGVTSAESMSP